MPSRCPPPEPAVEHRRIFVAIALVSLFNGLFSPMTAVVLSLLPFWMPEVMPVSVSLALMLSALISACGTLLISGIPAAVYERATGRADSTRGSMYVWLATAVLLSLPAAGVVARLL